MHYFYLQLTRSYTCTRTTPDHTRSPTREPHSTLIIIETVYHRVCCLLLAAAASLVEQHPRLIVRRQRRVVLRRVEREVGRPVVHVKLGDEIDADLGDRPTPVSDLPDDGALAQPKCSKRSRGGRAGRPRKRRRCARRWCACELAKVSPDMAR